MSVKSVLCPIAVGTMLLLPGCASTTVFQATFNSDSIGSPPSPNQDVGTVGLDEGAGTVRVGPPPSNATTNWVQISHPTAQSNQTAMQGKFAQFRGDGTYGLLAVLFIPTGCGVVTLQFEPFQNSPTVYANFMHLDFMPNNTVRVDDGGTVFGTFPRDRFFTVSVTLNIASSSSKAELRLFGNGASGQLDVNVDPVLQGAARRFGAVRFWMGSQHTGRFEVDQIIVTHKKP